MKDRIVNALKSLTTEFPSVVMHFESIEVAMVRIAGRECNALTIKLKSRDEEEAIAKIVEEVRVDLKNMVTKWPHLQEYYYYVYKCPIKSVEGDMIRYIKRMV